ncbi:hypothetical protein FQN55_003867 [Onygenales sp. PD_40]|nr:hypothetical protein FQN55_003867 [Onygenales sp. PD_40]
MIINPSHQILGWTELSGNGRETVIKSHARLTDGLIRHPEPLQAEEFYKRHPLLPNGADAAFDLRLDEVIVCTGPDSDKEPASIEAPSVTDITLTTSSGGKFDDRAVLHPKQGADIISLELVQELGLKMRKYNGKPVRVLTKAGMKPLGCVEAEWRFAGSLQKIHRTTFLVVHVRGFAILLGTSYIQQHDLRVYEN